MSTVCTRDHTSSSAQYRIGPTRAVGCYVSRVSSVVSAFSLPLCIATAALLAPLLKEGIMTW